MRNYFPKRPSGAPLHTLSKLYDVPVGFTKMYLARWITVNVVIFAGGKFRENVGKTFHVGVIFTILLIFSS